MSVNTENTLSIRANNAQRTITGFSSDLIEQKIRVNLEILNAQFLTLIHSLNQLIQEKWAGPRTHRL